MNAGAPQVFTFRIPGAPVSFSFAKRTWKSGAKFAIGSLAAFGTSGFLATQVAAAPSLQRQTVLLSVICALAGAALGHLALRSLCGRCRMDASGIRISPRYVGGFIPWRDLQKWEADVLGFRFTVAGRKSPVFVDREYLTFDDQSSMHSMLWACVPEKEIARAV
ncbi:MAG: hypothetical protein C0483_00560 [Pirellula sp.]|nr:hypothetical protein [Pirellula sp.]